MQESLFVRNFMVDSRVAETARFLVFISSLILCLLVVSAVIIRIGMGVEFVGTSADIEQLRKDVQSVDASESEDVIGQVTEANRLIRKAQTLRGIPVFGWMLPSGWDVMKPIEIPKRSSDDAILDAQQHDA